MIFAALDEAAQRGELLLVQDGLLRFHRRRDGIFVIHEILVLPFRRRTGVGRNLVREVLIRAGGHVVRALCPAEYDAANRFWPSMGFTLMETRATRKGTAVNVWQRPSNLLAHGEAPPG